MAASHIAVTGSCGPLFQSSYNSLENEFDKASGMWTVLFFIPSFKQCIRDRTPKNEIMLHFLWFVKKHWMITWGFQIDFFFFWQGKLDDSIKLEGWLSKMQRLSKNKWSTLGYWRLKRMYTPTFFFPIYVHTRLVGLLHEQMSRLC